MVALRYSPCGLALLRLAIASNPYARCHFFCFISWRITSLDCVADFGHIRKYAPLSSPCKTRSASTLFHKKLVVIFWGNCYFAKTIGWRTCCYFSGQFIVKTRSGHMLLRKMYPQTFLTVCLEVMNLFSFYKPSILIAFSRATLLKTVSLILPLSRKRVKNSAKGLRQYICPGD